MTPNKHLEKDLVASLLCTTHRAWLAGLAHSPENIEEVDPVESHLEALSLAERLAMDMRTTQSGR